MSGASCVGCGHGYCDPAGRDGRIFLHCGNTASGHRCHYVVEISSKSGVFLSRTPPVWCGGYKEKASSCSHKTKRERKR